MRTNDNLRFVAFNACILFNLLTQFFIDLRFFDNSFTFQFLNKLTLILSFFLFLILLIFTVKTVKVNNIIRILLILFVGFNLLKLIFDIKNIGLEKINTLFFHEFTLPFLLLPLGVILGHNTKLMTRIFRRIGWLSVLSVFFCLLVLLNNIPIQRSYGYLIFIILGLLVDGKRQLIYLLIMSLMTLSFLHFGNRAIFGFFLIIVIYRYLPFKMTLKNIIVPVSLITLALGFLFYREILLWFSSSFSIDNSDTRTFLYLEIFTELDLKEILLGRGLMGTYYSEYFEKINLKSEIDRFSVEVGFLQYILKTGLISYLLLMVISIQAILSGLKSINKLKLNLAIFLLVIIVFQFLAFRPLFDSFWIMNWMIVGYLISEKDNFNSNEKEDFHSNPVL